MSDFDSLPSQPERPRGLRWLCAGLVLVGLVNLGVALRAAQFSGEYLAFGVAFPPLLQVIGGLGWGIGLLVGAWRLWRLRNGSTRLVLLLIGLYALYQVIVWRVFARSDYAVLRWPFAALAAVLIVMIVFWYLSRPPVRAAFCVHPSSLALTDDRGLDSDD